MKLLKRDYVSVGGAMVVEVGFWRDNRFYAGAAYYETAAGRVDVMRKLRKCAEATERLLETGSFQADGGSRVMPASLTDSPACVLFDKPPTEWVPLDGDVVEVAEPCPGCGDDHDWGTCKTGETTHG